MNELKKLCKERGLSFILFLDNHKRFGLTVDEYFTKFKPNGFEDESGKKEIEDYNKADSWAMIEVFDHELIPRFVCYDRNITRCIKGTVTGIKEGIDFRKPKE